jgi:hypothetical protein
MIGSFRWLRSNDGGVFRCIRDDRGSNCRFEIFYPIFRVERVAFGVNSTHVGTRPSLSHRRGRTRRLAIP